MTKAQALDLLERAGWTAGQAGLGVLITYAGSIPAWWALPIATALSAVKTWVVHRLPAESA